MTKSTKDCPLCGEEILEVAIKCKYCGSMLDGSDQEQKVTISGVDPMAELHTPIKGKSKGKLTAIGKMGIGLGILIVIVSFVSFGSAAYDVEIESIGVMMLVGFGFIIASYLWARRPDKK